MIIHTKVLISLDKLKINNMQRTNAFAIAAVFSECGLPPSLSEYGLVSFLTTPFFGGMIANNVNVYIIVRGNLFVYV